MGIQNLLQPSFGGGEWSPELAARVDLQKYASALSECVNFVVHPHGGVSKRPGTYFIGEATAYSRLVPFQYNTEQSYVLLFSASAAGAAATMRVIYGYGFVMDGDPPQVVEVATPYQGQHLAGLNFAQSGDVLYIAHQNYAPRTLRRNAHASWTLAQMAIGPGVAAPTGVTSTAGTYEEGEDKGDNKRFAITAVDANGNESIGATGTGNSKCTAKWTGVAAIHHYNVYLKKNGVYGWCGRVSGGTANDRSYAFTKNEGTASTAVCQTETYNPFSGNGNQPGTVGFFQGRLIFANTINRPQTFWGSVAGHFQNFNRTFPAQDDDSYEFTIDSGAINEIRAVVGLDGLMLFTAGEEYQATGGGDGAAITAASVNVAYQSGNGSSRLPPLKISDNILYMQASSARVRDMAYSLEADGYKGNDLSIMATHLFEGHSIKAWCYQRHPDSVIWCVRDDGVLLGLTYMKEHQVWGWHQHRTAGRVLDVCAVSTADGSDDVYFIVRRACGDGLKFYVERLEEPHDAAPEEGFYVDCGLAAEEDEPIRHVTGLSHLEGQTVVALADGKECGPFTVENGAIDLPFPARVLAVGLPYEARLTTMAVAMQNEQGSVLDKPRAIKSAIVKLRRARGLEAANWPGEGGEPDWEEVNFNAGQPWGAAAPLFSGDRRVLLRAPDDFAQGKMMLRCKGPVPCSVLAIVPLVESGEVNQ